MKLFGLLLVVGFAAQTQADVKPVGQFVPSECTFIEDTAATNACVGELSGMNQTAIELKINDGTTRVYAINAIKIEAGKMGVQNVKIEGANVADKNDTLQGIYHYSSGIRLLRMISVKTSSGLNVESELETVFVTMAP